MQLSRRKYYSNLLIAMLVMGVLILIGAPIINKYIFQLKVIDKIIKYMILGMVIMIAIIITIQLIANKGIRGLVRKYELLNTMESNLISIGAFKKIEGKNYVVLPKIKIKENDIIIKLDNIKIRTIIERYLNSFSTALPSKYIVEDYYISQNNAEVIIKYEDIKNYIREEYSIAEYKKKIQCTDMLDLYFDKKHIVNVNDYPHFLVSGSSGSGKSYFVNEIVIQAIIKGWEIVVVDLKRSYGLFKDFIDYVYEIDDIVDKLSSIEAEMMNRMECLQVELDKNPRALAVDIGFKPKLVIVEEYISLQASLDKKKKEELERIVKNISVLARQSNIHLMIVLQSAGTENIQSTTRSNLTKVLLGNAQSNILNATFGNGVDIPTINTKLNKGEGLIQLDRITLLRVPKINDLDSFKDVIFYGAEGMPKKI